MRKTFLLFFLVAVILKLTDTTIIITHSMPKIFQLSANKMAIVFDQNQDAVNEHLDKLQEQEQNQQVQAQSAPAQAQYKTQLEQAQTQQGHTQYQTQIQQQQQQVQSQYSQIQSQSQSSQPSGVSIQMVNAEGQSVSHHSQAYNQHASSTISNDGKAQTHTQVTQYASVFGGATGLKYTSVGVYGLPANFHETIDNPTPTSNLPKEDVQETEHQPVVKPTYLDEEKIEEPVTGPVQETQPVEEKELDLPVPTSEGYNGGQISSGAPAISKEEQFHLPAPTSEGYTGGQISSGSPDTHNSQEVFELPQTTSEGSTGGQIDSGAPTVSTEEQTYDLPVPTSGGYTGGKVTSGSPIGIGLANPHSEPVPVLMVGNPTVTTTLITEPKENIQTSAQSDIENVENPHVKIAVNPQILATSIEDKPTETVAEPEATQLVAQSEASAQIVTKPQIHTTHIIQPQLYTKIAAQPEKNADTIDPQTHNSQITTENQPLDKIASEPYSPLEDSTELAALSEPTNKPQVLTTQIVPEPQITSNLSTEPAVSSNLSAQPKVANKVHVETKPTEINNDIESFHEAINSSPLIGLASPGSF